MRTFFCSFVCIVSFVTIFVIIFYFHKMDSIDKVSKVKSPVLVIHGTDDEVIDFSHGIGIYERCPKAVEPLWVEVSYLKMLFKDKII